MVFVALAFSVSPGVAEKVRVDFDHQTHFSCYKTYSWAQPPVIQSAGTQFPNQLMQERIVGFIEEALAARGLKRVPKGGDLLLKYQMNVTEQPQFVTFSDGWGPGWGAGWGPGWGWGSGFSTTTVETIYKGTLVVDMADSRQKQLVFQGVSTQPISSRPARNTKRLSKAVNEIFEKFPPQL
jgi:hypothetical protein